MQEQHCGRPANTHQYNKPLPVYMASPPHSDCGPGPIFNRHMWPNSNAAMLANHGFGSPFFIISGRECPTSWAGHFKIGLLAAANRTKNILRFDGRTPVAKTKSALWAQTVPSHMAAPSKSCFIGPHLNTKWLQNKLLHCCLIRGTWCSDTGNTEK